jgi:hypothetical protein
MEGLLICPVWATQAPHGLALAWTSTKVPFDFAARTTRTNAVNAALVWLHDHTELPYELISMVGAWVTEPEFQPPAHQRTQRRIRHKNGKTTTQATVFVQCHPARSFCLRKDSTHQFFVTFARTADEMRPAVANHGVYPMRETSAAHQVSTSRCATETVSRARNDPLRHKNRRPLYLTRPGKRATVLLRRRAALAVTRARSHERQFKDVALKQGYTWEEDDDFEPEHRYPDDASEWEMEEDAWSDDY